MAERSDRPRVAVIGAGWAGLQLLQSLKERGIQAEVFDKCSSVGGTWAPEMRYQSLTLHSARWINSMSSYGKMFPFRKMDAASLNGKADAQEMHAYLNDFVEQHCLRPYIRCNSLVREIQYNSVSRRAHLIVTSGGDGAPSRRGPYDLVVFSSVSGKPIMPDIPDRGFCGQVLHSSELRADIIDDIIQADKHVLILGAGKSGCDMVSTLVKQSHSNFTWLFRSPYWFYSYETVFHSRSLAGMLRALLAPLCVSLFLISHRLGMLCFWLSGYCIQPCTRGLPKHFDGRRFHFGILDQNEVNTLKSVETCVASSKELGPQGMVLQDGRLLPCDVVIYATGYETGFDELRLVKNGRPVDALDRPLHHHVVVPTFPCLLVAPCAYYHFGPIRAVSLAQYIEFYLKSAPSEEHMLKSARGNWCIQRPSKHILFGSGHVYVTQWVLMYIDLVRGGVIRFSSLLRYLLQIFVTGVYTPLPIQSKVLPSHGRK